MHPARESPRAVGIFELYHSNLVESILEMATDGKKLASVEVAVAAVAEYVVGCC